MTSLLGSEAPPVDPPVGPPVAPPPDKWDDWVELDPTAWPTRVEKHYSLIPTICFNCESACGLVAYVENNPLKARFCARADQWQWSSYRHYALREIGTVEIESEWTARDREKKDRGGSERIFLVPG